MNILLLRTLSATSPQATYMVGIDRAVKHVLVSGGRKVPYDHLIFYTGQQYQVPCPAGVDISQLPPNSQLLAPPNTIDVYTCVRILLSLGVEGFPPAPASVTTRWRSGVHVHHNCFLAKMNDGQRPESITFVKTVHILDFLWVFMNLSSNGVDYDAFQSNNNACLVYDGRLVIDTTFHTSDSTIRAVGPLTKFPRHYHSDQWSHSRFNSREVDQELAAILLPFFDLTLELAINPPADLDRLITNYTQTICYSLFIIYAFTSITSTPVPLHIDSVPVPPVYHPAIGRIETGLVHDLYR
uniref:Uncharacterized protein n=1 Tax=Oncorhynchus tshawytscha TaxID=74940 RepID=A0A8C8G2X6_ONCTS